MMIYLLSAGKKIRPLASSHVVRPLSRSRDARFRCCETRDARFAIAKLTTFGNYVASIYEIN